MPRATADARIVGVRRLRDGARADAVRLWYLGAELDEAPARAACGGGPLDALVAAGFLARADGGVRARFRVVPFREVLVAHDRDDVRPRPNHVLGVGGATRSLAALTVRRRGGRLLDLGTGSGTQALLAARADPDAAVVATDLNRRAAALARANAALNAVEARLDVRTGDLYAPVEGERFDTIASNPPFVVSPEFTFAFRDGGRPGDAMSRTVVRGAAEHLAEGGFATVLVNWIVPSGSETAAEPTAWLEGLGCDALILHHETVDVVEYATRWIVRPERPAGSARAADTFGRTVDRWLAWYEDHEIERIAFGVIVLRRRTGANWTRAVEMRAVPTGDGSRQLERMFAAHDRFGDDDAAADARLTSATLRLVDRHRLEQHLVFEGGEYQPHHATLRLDDSAGVVARVPADALELLFGLDGERPLGAVIAELADVREQPMDAVAGRTIPVVRELVRSGFVEPVDRT